MQRGFKAQANRIAVEIRAALGLSPVAPLDPLAVCNHFEIEVFPLSRLGNVGEYFLGKGMRSFSAVTVPNGLRRGIVHNDSHSRERQRSNLMHELAHGFLGHPPCSAFDCNGERAYNHGIEAEAAFLSGTLLITNEGAWHIVRTSGQAHARIEYGVSRQMLNYRLRVSGALTRELRVKGKQT